MNILHILLTDEKTSSILEEDLNLLFELLNLWQKNTTLVNFSNLQPFYFLRILYYNYFIVFANILLVNQLMVQLRTYANQ